MASLTHAMNGSPPEPGPMGRIIGDADPFAGLSPVDALKLSMELRNKQRVSPEQATANRQQNLRDLLSIVPGPGNVIAAEDAVTAGKDAASSFGEGRYGQAAMHGGLSALSAFGAVTGFPTGRMAGNAARGASSRTNIFAGPMAKTADQAALTRAQEMSASGVGRDAIHAQTGWFQGVDGKWRFEIDDSGAALKGLEKGKVARFSGIDHPELEEAYGRLAPVHGMVKPNTPEEGAFLPGGRNVPPYIHAQGRTPESAKSVALHEFQHGAQNVEGFATGGSPKSFARELPSGGYDNGYELYRRLAGEVEARNVQARMNMTAAERRAKAPWLTQDVPDNQQIVRGR